MALKVFCNICGKFIKDVEPKQSTELTGKEICPECGVRLKDAYRDIMELQQTAHKEITATIVAIRKKIADINKLEETTKHKVNLIYDKAKAELEEAKKKIIEPKIIEKKVL